MSVSNAQVLEFLSSSDFPNGKVLAVDSSTGLTSTTSPGQPLTIATYGALRELAQLVTNQPGIICMSINGHIITVDPTSSSIGYNTTDNVLSVVPNTTNQRVTVANGSSLYQATAGILRFLAGDNIGLTTKTNTNGEVEIRISANASDNITVLDSTVTSQTIATNTRYVATSTSLVTFNLPTTGINPGDQFGVYGSNTGGWKIAQQAGQQIKFGNKLTTSGATGYLQSFTTQGTDCIDICCYAPNSFLVTSSQGNITVI